MSILDRAAHNTLRHQAASLLATWILKVQLPPGAQGLNGRQGLTPPQLVALVRRQEPIFRDVLNTLSQAPNWDPDVIRSSKRLIERMGQERELQDGTVIDEGLDDYWQILRQDVLHEQCHEHALALGDAEVWDDFCRQMDMAKELLLAI